MTPDLFETTGIAAEQFLQRQARGKEMRNTAKRAQAHTIQSCSAIGPIQMQGYMAGIGFCAVSVLNEIISLRFMELDGQRILIALGIVVAMSWLLQKKEKGHYHCVRCRYKGQAETLLYSVKGGVLALALFILSPILGMLYVILRWNTHQCPICGSTKMERRDNHSDDSQRRRLAQFTKGERSLFMR